MAKLSNTGALLLAGALTLAAATAAAQSVKVGYVNLARVEKESATAARASEMLKQEFEPRALQIQELQKRIESGKERLQREKDKLAPPEFQTKGRELSEMMKKSDQMLMRFTEEYEARRGELRARLLDEATAAVKVVAETGKFDLILQEAAFARSTVDVTPLVLKEMAKRGNAFK